MSYKFHIQLKMSLKHYLLLPLLFLSQLVLGSAQESKQIPDCTIFNCGRFGEVGFPFSNTRNNPKCGLSVMNCTGPVTKVQFHEQGKWYHVDSLNYLGRMIKIRDPEVQIHLESNRCDLLNNFTEKVSPFLSINVTETPPFFKCKHEPTPISPPSFFTSFHRYDICKDYELYFYGEQEGILPSLPEALSKRCSVVHSSRLKGFDLHLMIDRCTVLSDADFTLNWQVRPDCLECEHKGGQCQTFECGNLKGSNTAKKALIGVGTGIGGVLLTCIIFFIIYQRHKRNKLSSSLTLISRDISHDLSSKQDLEKGRIYFKTPIFSYEELNEATNHFDSKKKLGDGDFGTVYHGFLRDGRIVAVKRLFEHNYKRVEQFMNEIQILSRLRHKNLVSLYGCTSQHSHELLLVYEYVPNGTVADHLHGDRANAALLTWPIRMSIAIESADALTYLHASDIIHLAVKTNHILLDNSFHVKVAGFGLSRLFPMEVTHVSITPQGTPGYADPEYYQCYQLNDKSDVYSFGVVLIELISSIPALDIGRNRHGIQTRALRELVDPSLGFESDYNVRNMITLVAELAFRCLQQEKETRPSMVEVLETLRGIESEEYKTKKTDEMDISADARPLKNSRPLSPDSVAGPWVSKSITPNDSRPLKNSRLFSLDSVTGSWVSKSTTPNDAQPLKNSQPLSPDSVTASWVSKSTTPSDARPLKNSQPLSPASVTAPWVSKSTTPNDAPPLENSRPLSPDSVTAPWASKSTTR